VNLGLERKCAVVTGASRGIGRAIALSLAHEGAHVAVCARGTEALQVTERDLLAIGVKAYAQTCDVANPAALEAFLDSARRVLGAVDILVNNASALAFADDEAGWRASIDIDLMAAVRAVWKVVPWMKERGGGSIIHVSSGSGLEAGSPPAYAAAKAALISHSKTMAISLAPHRIRVNVLAPGSIEFPGGVWDRIRHEQRQMYDQVLGTIPTGRMGTAEEVANAATFLASDRASWITGVCLRIDGGQGKANL
jgi:3-oxoacyl-[acyl-carrier protein] reductase